MPRIQIAVALMVLTTGTISARAGTMSYEISTTASGTLNGVAFSDATVTAIGIGNTKNVASNPTRTKFTLDFSSATIAVSGFGTATLDGTTDITINSSGVLSFVGSSGHTILGLEDDSAAAGYNLESTIGPITGQATFDSGASFTTSLGDLILTSVSASPTGGKFVAFTGSAVPEPSSLAIASTGVALIIGALGLRRRASRTPIG